MPSTTTTSRATTESSYEQDLIDLGVPVTIFQSITLNQGIPTGVGNIFNEGGYGTMAIEKSSYSMIRGDVTWYKQLKGTRVSRVPDRLPAHAAQLLQGHQRRASIPAG